VGHGEGLARTGDPQEHLVALGLGEAGDQLLDRLRLIARRREVGGQIKGPAIQLVRQRCDGLEDRRGHGVYMHLSERLCQDKAALTPRAIAFACLTFLAGTWPWVAGDLVHAEARRCGGIESVDGALHPCFSIGADIYQ
jgi:hypothetical protein